MLIIAHISLMIAAMLCLCAGIGLAMFGRKKKFWLSGHQKFNITGSGLLVAGVMAAFAGVAASDGHHLAGIHQWAGAFALVLTLITLFFGFVALKARNKIRARSRHGWSGRISLVASGITLAFGLKMIGIL